MTIEVELPDGRVLEVDAPDERAAAFAAKAFMDKESGTISPYNPAPGAKMGAPLAGAGPGGRDVEWWQKEYNQAPVAPALQPGQPERVDGRGFFGRLLWGNMTPEDTLQLGAQNVGKGLANLAGLPVDLATAAVNLGAAGIDQIPGVDVGRITNPVGGSQSIKNMAAAVSNAAGVTPIDDQYLSPSQRVLNKATEWATEGVVGGGLFSRLGTTVRGAKEAVAPVAQPYQAALEASAQTPSVLRLPGIGNVNAGGLPAAAAAAKPVAKDAVMGAGAGTALGVRDENAPQDSFLRTPIADMILALVGGGIGAKGFDVAAAPATAGSSIARRMTTDPDMAQFARSADGETPSVYVADKARRQMQGAATDPKQAAENIRAEAAAYADANTTAPTSGILSNDPGLLTTEKTLRNRNAPEFIKRDDQIKQQAVDDVQAVRPRGYDTLTGRESGDYIAQRFREEEAAAQARVAQADQGRAAVQAQATEEGLPLRAQEGRKPQISAALDREVVDNTMRPMQARKNELFEGIDPNREVQRPIEPFRAAADDIRTQYNRLVPAGTQAPEVWLRQIDNIVAQMDEGGPGTISFGEINAMRPELTAAINKAREAGSVPLARALQRLRGEIDADIQRLADAGGPEAAQAQDAMRYYRDDFAPAFAQGEGGALRKDILRDQARGQGRVTTPPSATADRFLNPKIPEAAQSLRAIVDRAPNAAAAEASVRDYFLSDMSRLVQRDGSINLPQLQRWRREWGGVLDQFPTFRTEVDDMAAGIVQRRGQQTQLEADLTAAQTNLETTRQTQASSPARALVNADPETGVADIVASRDPARAVRETVARLRDNPTALASFKKSMTDFVEGKISNTAQTLEGDNALSAAKADRFFKRYDEMLPEIYSPTEMNALRRARKQVMDLARLSNAKVGGVSSDTAQNMADMMRYTEIGLKVWKGGLRGGNLFRNLKLALGTGAATSTEAQAARIVKRAMFDPELAAHLLEANVTPATKAAWNKRLNVLLGGAEAIQNENEE